MDLLRFLTAGSVDDGKSTLIGRLLYDSKNILIDQLDAIERSSKNRKDGSVDLALLTDGLRAEREQGITIDVAYKYFSTPKRKFIIADTPGHIQYTRNMVTGASNADLIIILVDARNGVVEQTRRHSLIASLLNIPHVVVAINKMDLLNYDANAYDQIVADYRKVAATLQLSNVSYVPISALAGDNIVDSSTKMDWYQGPTLLEYLENVEVKSSVNLTSARFPVQYVIRPQTDAFHDYRGYAGKIESGIYKKGDQVVVYPSGVEATIEKIELGGKEVEEAFAPQSVVLHLDQDVDISRGDSIVKKDDNLKVSQDIDAIVCWMDEKPLTVGQKYFLQHGSKVVAAMVKEIKYKLDVNELKKIYEVGKADLNEVVEVKLKTASALAYDAYSDIRESGGAILVDQTSFVTVGAALLQ